MKTAGQMGDGECGVSLFSGISEDEFKQIKECFRPNTVKYADQETIMAYSGTFEKIAYLVSGKAHLYFIDYSGESGTIEMYSAGDVFGDLFFMPVEGLEYIVEADSACEVMFIDYHHITKRCPNACRHHSALIDNLFRISAEKAKKLTLRLNILARRTLRKKLLSYIEYLCKASGSRSVRIPMKMSTLSQYLCADRCAVAREMKKLNDEGIITSSGRCITLLKSEV